ncbi:MAG: hypothetical protein WC477_07430 [Patescibacteria group bacterium]
MENKGNEDLPWWATKKEILSVDPAVIRKWTLKDCIGHLLKRQAWGEGLGGNTVEGLKIGMILVYLQDLEFLNNYCDPFYLKEAEERSDRILP